MEGPPLHQENGHGNGRHGSGSDSEEYEENKSKQPAARDKKGKGRVVWEDVDSDESGGEKDQLEPGGEPLLMAPGIQLSNYRFRE
jgi:hypothetical protein